MKTFILCFVLLAVTACDKGNETVETPAKATNAATTGASVDELVDKLPAAAPKQQPTPPKPDVQFFGKFSSNAARPTSAGETPVTLDPKALGELNVVAKFRVESAFVERRVTPGESIIVQFGGEDTDGLLITVRYGGRSASHKIPPANNGPELVSNLDHTVDRVLDELGIPRRQ